MKNYFSFAVCLTAFLVGLAVTLFFQPTVTEPPKEEPAAYHPELADFALAARLAEKLNEGN